MILDWLNVALSALYDVRTWHEIRLSVVTTKSAVIMACIMSCVVIMLKQG
jgi:hypothetical protein